VISITKDQNREGDPLWREKILGYFGRVKRRSQNENMRASVNEQVDALTIGWVVILHKPREIAQKDPIFRMPGGEQHLIGRRLRLMFKSKVKQEHWFGMV